MPRRVACCLFLMLFSVLAGCSQNAKLGHVRGIVRLDGKPLATGSVRFVPDAGRAATGTIQPDGSYYLGTYSQSDGALIGTHRVVIIAYEGSGDVRPAYETPSKKSKSLVPERYSAPGTSGLTFIVKPGDNQADFDLTSK